MNASVGTVGSSCALQVVDVNRDQSRIELS
jgi:hypothetical protein